MGVDWTKIRNEYINTDIGMRRWLRNTGWVQTRSNRAQPVRNGQKHAQSSASKPRTKCVQKSAQAVAAAEADRLSAAARIRAKATQYLDKRMDTLLESGQKAYEVKVVMETLRLIADMEKSDAGAAEDAAVQIVEDLTQ